MLVVAWFAAMARFCDAELMRTTTSAIAGHFLEIAVYRDVPAQTLACLWRLCRLAFTVGRLLLPAALLLLPGAAVLTWCLQSGYGQRPLQVGEAALLSVKASDISRISLRLPAEVTSDSEPVEVPERGRIYWRIRASQPGVFPLVVSLDGRELSKTLVVGSGPSLLRPARTEGGMPLGEANLPAGSWAQEIRVNYPSAPHWWLLWLAVLAGCGALVAPLAQRR